MDPEMQKIRETAATAAQAGWLQMIHVLGAIVYAGGLLSAARFLGLLVKADASARVAAAAFGRRVYLAVTLPAGLLMVLTGLYMLVLDPWSQSYFGKTWFVMKFALAILLLLADHLLVMRPLKGLAKGTSDPASHATLYRAGFVMILLILFVLVAAIFVVRRMA